jgi:protein-tyrosine-phosphatase
MNDRIYNVLFLCTGNSARSIMAEAVLNVLGAGRFRAFSAGSHPSGAVQPLAAELAQSMGYPAGKMRSKSWDEFAVEGAPEMDMVITVCDNAAGEACPLWPGQPVTAHWGVADPAAVQGSDEDKRNAFLKAFTELSLRIDLMLDLPLDKLDRRALTDKLKEIGKTGSAA